MTLITLYRAESCVPKANAQRNLAGRTHYVDDDTLKYHKSRIMSARALERGLLFGLVTLDALNAENTKRGFRYVVFDVFGYVVARVDLESAYRSRQKAAEAMYAWLETADAAALTRDAIERERRAFDAELTRLNATVNQIAADKAA